jgi:sodium-dependent dicarboxylate transporter 2/3/5
MENVKKKIKSVSPGKWFALAVAVFFMFGTAIITPPTGLTQSGFQVLGILVGASILFLTWGTGWPSMATLFAFITVPDLTVSQATQATFGNSTLIFLMFTFMLAGCLTKSGVARRVAVWFITNKLSRKNPWWAVAMIFIAMFVISLPLSSAATFMIMFPIVEEIFFSVGITKDQKAPLATLLILGLLVMGLLANGGNPIAHAMTLQGFSFYEAYTNSAMDFFTYCAICTPVTVVAAALFFLLARFVWRPDVSALAMIDYDALTANTGKMSKKEKWSAFFYLLCVIFWLLPGLTQYLWPAANAAIFSKIQQCLPPLLALFLMNFIKVDGEPIFKWEEAVSCVSLPLIMFIACIMGLGSFMGNSNLGIATWLSTVFTPIFSNVSPFVFMLVLLSFSALLSNFCTASVPVSLTFAIAMPLCAGIYAGQINPLVMAALTTVLGSCAWTTAPSSPISAISYGSGWIIPKEMIKWGLITTGICVATAMTLGVAIGNTF